MGNKRSTLHVQTVNGTPCLVPNRCDELDTGSPHWHISYNNHDRKDYGSDTTALVIGNGECFFILNGDHRENFRKVIETYSVEHSKLVRCLMYVRENKDKLNHLSDFFVAADKDE